jgi:adenine-specific DNA methylase
MSVTPYPKRLIEVDLPIARISTHARREKNIKHGHFSSLHIWWARRPLAACRAVICASLWPDPVDLAAWQRKGEEVAVGDSVVRPARFLETAQGCMIDWGKRHLSKVSPESYSTFIKIQQGNTKFDDPNELRGALLDFIADFANWDNSTDPAFVDMAGKLTQAAHEALGGDAGTRPLIVDPFAGGGAIPLEALRVGADAFASDLNPVAVLLNKVVLEYIPKYGQRLARDVLKWGEWIKQQAEKKLAEFYPEDPDGATPIAYLWARTIRCEGPGCGVEIPLLNQRLISKRRAVGVEFVCKSREVITNIRCDLPASEYGAGTVSNGTVTCPRCAFTMPAKRYRERSRNGHLGERHYCTVLARPDGTRKYRNPSDTDKTALRRVISRFEALSHSSVDSATVVPNERLSSTEPRRLNVLHYGFST